VTEVRRCGNKCGGVRKSHSGKIIPLMITKPNNWGLVEKGTVCIYDNKPFFYTKLVIYGKASASSMAKASLPKLYI
jgi:hypothetical protein